jgi:hypothetical protein
MVVTQYTYNSMVDQGFFQLEGHGSNTYYGYTLATSVATFLASDAHQVGAGLGVNGTPAYAEVAAGTEAVMAEGDLDSAGQLAMFGSANAACIASLIGMGIAAVLANQTQNILSKVNLGNAALAAYGSCANLIAGDFGDHGVQSDNPCGGGICGIG